MRRLKSGERDVQMGNNEINDTFKDLRHASQSKREHNKRYSTKVLSSKRIKFRAVNNGYHLIIEQNPDDLIDFWPSTGLWKTRISNKKDRGLKSLLEYLNDTSSSTN